MGLTSAMGWTLAEDGGQERVDREQHAREDGEEGQLAEGAREHRAGTLEREEREQQAALRSVDKLIKWFEGRCFREGPER